MSTPADSTLLLFAADALDPGQAATVRAELARDPALEAHLLALSRDLDEEPVEQGFRVPPPGLGLPVTLQQAAALGPALMRAGDRFEVCLPPRPAPEREGVVVLRDIGAGWQIVSPLQPDRAIALSALPRSPDGGHQVNLLARPPRGRQRWAVALVPMDQLPGAPPPLASHEPWGSLRQGLEAGTVPVGVVEIELC
jgi:hypothetical protein